MIDDRGMKYIKEFDAFCYSDNGEWEEPKCTDPACEFCSKRPVTAHGYMEVEH